MAKAVRSCLKLTALISIRTPHWVFPNPRHHPSHHPRDPSPLPSLFFGGEDSTLFFLFQYQQNDDWTGSDSRNLSPISKTIQSEHFRKKHQDIKPWILQAFFFESSLSILQHHFVLFCCFLRLIFLKHHLSSFFYIPILLYSNKTNSEL